jgi:hypothetical protein
METLMNQRLLELRKYIDMVIEEDKNDLIHEMANVGPKRHGIDNVYIFVGKTNKQHGLRVKVSRVPGKYDDSDNFIIQMPSLDYDPEQVPRWIKEATMNKILSWIKLNQKLLMDYEQGVIWDTDEFLNDISRV